MTLATMSYASTMNVIDSWEQIRKMENYQQVMGVKLFQKFFELSPEALPVFAFGRDSADAKEFYQSPQLVRHAKLYIVALDNAIGMLGPNFEMLQDILHDLGDKHRRFGVTPDFLAPMGQAIIETLQDLLGKKFTPKIKDSWEECFQLLSDGMTE